MMYLPECVFISSKDMGELMLYTRPPYNLAAAYKFTTEKELERFIINHNLYGASCVCTDYRILICYKGTLDKVYEQVVTGHHVTKEILSTLNTLTRFYESERIKGNETRFKKFKR